LKADRGGRIAPSERKRVTKFLDDAVEGLRAAGTRNWLPRALIWRAILRRAVGEFDDAENDLLEAISIARSGTVQAIFIIDANLEYARLHLARYDRWNEAVDLDEARHCWETAVKLIDQIKYHRADREAKEIGLQLQAYEAGPSGKAPPTARAKGEGARRKRLPHSR
jgi:tetratricopeptide (TPR) repeat protein